MAPTTTIMTSEPLAGASAENTVRALRRIELMALGWALIGLVGWAVFERCVDGLIVLTLAAAASMVSFRGLQRLVWQLGAREGGKSSPPTVLFAVLRFSIVALLPLASIWLDTRQVLALVVGFSALPAALLSEGLLQLLRTTSERRDGS